MKTIHKYPIGIIDQQIITMPVEAIILTVQVQNGKPFIWAVVDIEAPVENISIRVYGIGSNVNESLNMEYIGAFHSMFGGDLVFHVFKEIKS